MSSSDCLPPQGGREGGQGLQETSPRLPERWKARLEDRKDHSSQTAKVPHQGALARAEQGLSLSKFQAEERTLLRGPERQPDQPVCHTGPAVGPHPWTSSSETAWTAYSYFTDGGQSFRHICFSDLDGLRSNPATLELRT